MTGPHPVRAPRGFPGSGPGERSRGPQVSLWSAVGVTVVVVVAAVVGTLVVRSLQSGPADPVTNGPGDPGESGLGLGANGVGDGIPLDEGANTGPQEPEPSSDPGTGTGTPQVRDAPGGTRGINLVGTKEISCAHDPGGSDAADLMVTVKVDDKTVISVVSDATEVAEFGIFVPVEPKASGSRVEVLVADDEGGGASVPCDIAPGPDRTVVFTWDGSRMSKALRGDDSETAEVFLELGAAPRLIAAASAEANSPHSARVSWSAAGTLDEVRVVYATGRVGKTADTGPVVLDGFCDGRAYTARVVGVQGAWHIGAEVAFETPNAAPTPPRVLAARSSGSTSLTVEWENPSHHDTDRFQIYVGPAGFAPSASTLRATDDHPGIYWHESQWMSLQQGDAEVIVRTIDTHGAYSDSERFGIGDPEREETTFGTSEC